MWRTALSPVGVTHTQLRTFVDLEGKTLTVIGGAGFVGSHLVDQLLEHGPARVRVLDNLKRGTRSNLERALEDPRVELIEASVTEPTAVRDAVAEADGSSTSPRSGWTSA